jgi:hypothetical protein
VQAQAKNKKSAQKKGQSPPSIGLKKNLAIADGV